MTESLKREQHGRSSSNPVASWSLSTRRQVRSGVVHEMADLGTGFLCGRKAPEPWTWTDAPITCKQCLMRIEQQKGASRDD